MSTESEIKRLANFIMAKVDGEPRQSEGAGTTAIRIIKTLQAKNKTLTDLIEAVVRWGGYAKRELQELKDKQRRDKK